MYQVLNMGEIPVQGSPLQGFKRLRRPSQLIAEGDADPLGPVIERENAARHDFTAEGCFRPGQTLFPTPHRAWQDLCRRLEPFPADPRRCHLLPPPSL